ncbi:MerR family transcriptional regulator [Amylibacter sp. IMCC11727]|uniref:MerR family transcriptional regulator n=1 Tax=Amylibacter sp. IMCC11727 TaxID=3039851 RepID=UPI00244DAD4D|nr:MerR family transcriptional regulator [Amylibacter sp. IMCC11727]WGI20738.1 MerR family transcriptional regulator [Amylibacter sp. IMCC11727]
MSKSPEAFRTISEVSEWLDTPTYVLRFWESRFPQIKPVKRAGGRRYYRPDDMLLLGGIKKLLHFDERSIKYVRGLLKEHGVKHVQGLSPDLNTQVVSPPSKADADDTADIDKMVKSKPAAKKAPKVDVRVVKKGKVAQDDQKADDAKAKASASEEAAVADAKETDSQDAMEKAKATEAARVKAAKQAAAQKKAADEEAEEWDDLIPDGVKKAPYRIQAAAAYDTDTMAEIETLYYSLRMARNSMRRAKKQQEKRAS